MCKTTVRKQDHGWMYERGYPWMVACEEHSTWTSFQHWADALKAAIRHATHVRRHLT